MPSRGTAKASPRTARAMAAADRETLEGAAAIFERMLKEGGE